MSKDGGFTYSNIIWLSNDVNNDISIYPSPVKDVLNINTANNKLINTNVQMVDANGRVISNFLLKYNHQQLEVAELANGIYLLKFADGTSHKIIKH